MKYDSSNFKKRRAARKKRLSLKEASMSTSQEFYWVAVNGCAVTVCWWPCPADGMGIFPTPEQLFGFKTAQEAQEAQQFLLTAPIDEIKRRYEEWLPLIKDGTMAYIRPPNPQPPIHEDTAWADDAEGEEGLA